MSGMKDAIFLAIVVLPVPMLPSMVTICVGIAAKPGPGRWRPRDEVSTMSGRQDFVDAPALKKEGKNRSLSHLENQ